MVDVNNYRYLESFVGVMFTYGTMFYLYQRINTVETRGGALYTRWGRNSCDTEGTETVYSGYSGGSSYSHTGAASEYVCLPKDPMFDLQEHDTYSGYMYGAQYQTDHFGQPQYHNVPCAVCRSNHTSQTLMIPARTRCYTGWKYEYSGMLAAGYAEHAAASQYVCVDKFPNTLNSDVNARDNDGKLFFPVRAVCGALKCPPYRDRHFLLCVVCTK